jgi:uncharacterized protein (TIGR02271 family)
MASTNESLKRMTEDNDFEVAENQPDVRGWTAMTADGQSIGTVTDLIIDQGALKVRHLEVELDGRVSNSSRKQHAVIPIEAADLDPGVNCVLIHSLTLEQIRALPAYDSADMSASHRSYARPAPQQESKRFTRAEEELRIGKRGVQAGEVRVGKHVETERVSRPVTLEKERVTVERRPVSDTSRQEVRIGEDQREVIVPIMEEEAVVEKRAVVKEELVVGKERVSERDNIEAEIRKERFDVGQNRVPGRKGGR